MAPSLFLLQQRDKQSRIASNAVLFMDKNSELILIGEIVSAVGIKGEVKVKSYSSGPDRFQRLDDIRLEKSAGVFDVKNIASAGIKGNMATIKFSDIQDRNAAESLVGAKLYIEESQLEELPEDTYYVRDLIGLRVLDQEDNPVGEIKDVLQNGPQDIYVIKLSEGKEAMVPAVKEFIKEIDINSKLIRINFIEGMLP